MSIAAIRKAALAASCAIAVSAWATAARGADLEGIFTLFVNWVDAGEVQAVVRGTDVLVLRSDLEAAGLSKFTATEVQVGSRKLISLSSVRPAVRFVLDEEEIAIRIHAPVELLPFQRVDLSAAPPDINYARRRSVFLNYAPRVALSSLAPATGGAFFESGVSESNRLYYSSVYASSVTGVSRGLTNVNFDDRPKMRRLTVGDTTVSAGPIGGSAVMAGLTFARDFGLNPYFSRFPTMRYTSSTDVPARVDVYVNGIRVRSETLQPGTFSLDNVRGLAGAGSIRYVLRDAFGRAQSQQIPYYVGPSVLAKGVSDYAVSAGLPRTGLGLQSFAYSTPSLISYYRAGISNALTAGARAEARWERVSGGPVVATATPLGLFELEVGGSFASEKRTGLAAIFSYQYIGRYFNSGASIRALTDQYANVALNPESDRSIVQTNVFVSVPVSRRISLASQTSVDVHRDVPTFARVSSFSQVQIARDIFLSAELALVTLGPPTATLDAFLSLTWTPDFGVYTSVAARTTAGVPGATVQVNKPATFGEDWSMAGAVDVSTRTRASMQHRLQTRVSNVSTFFDWQPEGGSLSLEPAGSIVWVEGGGLFLARPISDSFALVRVGHLKGVRVYLNAQEVGRTNKNGYLLVPSLISYYGSSLRIAPDDVPLDHTLEREVFTAAPPRRGAAFVDFPAKRAHYYRGRLRLVQGGVETIPMYGELAVKNGAEELVSAVGADGLFEFEGLASGRHEAEIRYKEDRCRFTLEATEAEAALVDLGVLRCEVK